MDRDTALKDRAACDGPRSNLCLMNRMGYQRSNHCTRARAQACAQLTRLRSESDIRGMPLWLRTRNTVEHRINPQPDVSYARPLGCGSQRSVVDQRGRTFHGLYHGATSDKAQRVAG